MRRDGKRSRKSGSKLRSDLDTKRYRIEVGHDHGVKPGNIMGAIANEAGLDGGHIGHIDIHADHSFVDLPVGMPKEVFSDLQNTRVCGQRLMISREGEDAPANKGGGKSDFKSGAKSGAKLKAKDKPKLKHKPKTKKKHAARTGKRRQPKAKPRPEK